MAHEEVSNGAATKKTVTFTAFKPTLVVEAQKVGDAVAFYKSAFGAVESGHSLYHQELRHVLSSELELGGSTFVVRDVTTLSGFIAKPEGTFSLETDDVEAAVEKAVTAGAIKVEVTEVEAQVGVKGKVTDPFGFTLIFSSPAKNVDNDEDIEDAPCFLWSCNSPFGPYCNPEHADLSLQGEASDRAIHIPNGITDSRAQVIIAKCLKAKNLDQHCGVPFLPVRVFNINPWEQNHVFNRVLEQSERARSWLFESEPEVEHRLMIRVWKPYATKPGVMVPTIKVSRWYLQGEMKSTDGVFSLHRYSLIGSEQRAMYALFYKPNVAGVSGVYKELLSNKNKSQGKAGKKGGKGVGRRQEGEAVGIGGEAVGVGRSNSESVQDRMCKQVGNSSVWGYPLALLIMSHPIRNTSDSHSVQVIIPQKLLARKSDMYVFCCSNSNNVAPKVKSKDAETDSPQTELKAGIVLLGPVYEIFFDMYDRYEPVNEPALDNCFISTFMMGNGRLVRTLIHTDVTKYLSFKAVDGSYVFVKGKVQKVPATPMEALKSPLMGIFEQRQGSKFFSFVQEYDEKDPNTHNGMDLTRVTTKELIATFGLDDNTIALLVMQ